MDSQNQLAMEQTDNLRKGVMITLREMQECGTYMCATMITREKE